MGKRKAFVGINVTEAERESIHKLAVKRGYTILSDYLRALIIRDAKSDNTEISFDVDRGGDRRGDKA